MASSDVTEATFCMGPMTSRDAVEMMRDAFWKREDFRVEVVNYTKALTHFRSNITCKVMMGPDGNVSRFMATESIRSV